MNADSITAGANAAARMADDAGRRALTLADVEKLDTLVAGFAPSRQLAIGRQLLEDPRVMNDPIVKGPLAAIRNGLVDVTSQDVRFTSLLDIVRRSIDQELGRMAGKVEPTVLVAGRYHPDYPVVGSIHANLQTLAAFRVI